MAKEKISFTAMSKEHLVELLKKAGNKSMTMDLLEGDIAMGCPMNEDGTFNFFDYAAWLYGAEYLGKE